MTNKTRITKEGKILIDGDYVGYVAREGNLKFAFLNCNMGLKSPTGLNPDELRKVAEMMEERPKAFIGISSEGLLK